MEVAVEIRCRNQPAPFDQYQDDAFLQDFPETVMKYLCLVYLEERRLEEVQDSHCVAFDNSIRDSGHCIASEALQSVQTATTVRMRNGKVSITDGPFAETKEQLAGFYLVEARDLDEAIQIASRIPPASVGSIEVRPIRPIRETVGRQKAAEH
jgi:hypothetical protein